MCANFPIINNQVGLCSSFGGRVSLFELNASGGDFMNNARPSHVDLQALARQVMMARGFQPDFPAAVQQQLADIKAHPPLTASTSSTGSDSPPGSESHAVSDSHTVSDSSAVSDSHIKDLRGLLWSSIDNDTSRDLDQIEVAEKLPNGDVKVRIGIADVDAFFAKTTPIDAHAARETTTVYTGVRMFPMLPEVLSTGASSLLENQDRLAVVTEFVVSADGNVNSGTVYRALVRNQAQLMYNSLGSWLEGTAAAPPKVAASADLQTQLKLQNDAAQALKQQRFLHGALNLDTNEVLPVVLNQEVVDMAQQKRNRATELIEDFMIAANGVVARLLRNVSSIRRIVRTPERWDRIVQLAASHGEILPAQPDSKALNALLLRRKAADPDRFADLSLTVIKLIGPGEYVLERPGDPEEGHFGLAVQDYTHSTAPNRRFADVVTQRLIKALMAGTPGPYSDDELESIANNCTLKGDAARKVERDMSKRLAAVAMSSRVGATFDAIVTGVTPGGTFVRVTQPHIEGMLTQGAKGLDVGDRLRAKLVRTDVQQGYIDFVRV
jgi:exoribonuclease-2